MDVFVSAVVVVVSIVSLATNKLDQGVDFVGGRTFRFVLKNQLKLDS
jgi:SecD/SecF fusion protein